MVAGANQDETTEKTQLKRELGLVDCTSLIIGSIIGTGIFVSPTSVLARSGSVGISLILWIISGIISILGALAFAELGMLIPESGAEYSYVLRGFQHYHPYWGPLPSFLTCWMQVLVLRPSNIAIYCLIFAEYAVATFLGDCPSQYIDLCKRLVAVCALGIMTAVNVYSVKIYVKLQVVFTVCKLLACAVVIVGGVYQISVGQSRDILSMEHVGTSTLNVGDIALALFGGLYAFGGWSALNEVTEEVINPERNILRSILIGLPLVTCLYCLMNIAYLTVLSPQEMISSPAVAVDFGERLFGNFKFILPLGVMLSAFGSGLNAQFGVSRFCYVAGREGHLMSVFSFVHIRRVTPVTAVLSQALLTVLFVVSGDTLSLIDFLGFIAWIFYGAAMVALIVLRRQPRKEDAVAFKTPIIIPWFMTILSLFLAVAPVVADPSLKYLSTALLLLFGVFVYNTSVYNMEAPTVFSNKITHVMQLLMEVVPPDK